jgi:hypothetical protein
LQLSTELWYARRHSLRSCPPRDLIGSVAAETYPLGSKTHVSAEFIRGHLKIFRSLIGVCFLPVATLPAQLAAPSIIPDAVACVTCRISVSTVVTLGSDDGAGAIHSTPLDVSVDGRNRYWVVPIADQSALPIVFDAQGGVIRTIGRRGKGPGEFSRVVDAIPLPGDSALLLDSETRRATIVGPDLEPVRFIQIPEPLQFNVVRRWPAEVVGMSHYAGGGRGGPVLHVMAFDVEPPRVIRSFGPAWTIRDITTMEKTVARVFPATEGVLSIVPQRYRVERWSYEGQLLKSLERRPEWFSVESVSAGTRDTPPSPRFTAVAEDTSGRLWSFLSVAAPTWREGWPKDRGETRVVAFSMEKMYRTVIEVLDPKENRVIARLQLNDWIIAVLPDNRAVVYTVNADGFPRLRIVRYALLGS